VNCTDKPAIRRVLMTADTVGGVWTYALELCRALADRNVEVALATMGSPLRKDQWRQAGEIPHLQIYESSFRLEWMHDPWADLEHAADWLLTLENEVNPDIVHLNGLAHGDLPWHAPHVIVAHSCVLSWWRAVHAQEASHEWNRYKEMVTRGLQKADIVIAPSNALLCGVQKYYGPLHNTAVIPNGRDPISYRILEKEPFVFAAGRVWDEAKNLQCLQQVHSKIDWPILIAGDQTHPDGGKRSIPDVRMLGQLPADELASWYSRASVYCHPARYEPFGLCVLEAALSGCALVLGDIPSLRENWDGAATFAPPDDPQVLAAELNEVIGNSVRRHALAANAYARALSFTPRRMAESYLCIYRNLAASRTPMAIAEK
jgi:glycogen synthase